MIPPSLAPVATLGGREFKLQMQTSQAGLEDYRSTSSTSLSRQKSYCSLWGIKAIDLNPSQAIARRPGPVAHSLLISSDRDGHRPDPARETSARRGRCRLLQGSKSFPSSVQCSNSLSAASWCAHVLPWSNDGLFHPKATARPHSAPAWAMTTKEPPVRCNQSSGLAVDNDPISSACALCTVPVPPGQRRGRKTGEENHKYGCDLASDPR
ncbi:hypothetical protein IF1G_05937 [Cordyceps javanica]|uniref:Uncharacterized protein n=1 Tax=Cordyceps javanica TaxID=43265 RepID=A0A545UZP5_9HYPO|nr:hypothetical protein IF1G_05937 [Cordyceps javanica]